MTSVLVVDDEPQILRGLRTNLRARGYEVFTAPDGETALATAAKERPDLAIIDLGLPGIDGVEVIRGIRAWSEMPLLVLSARDQERDKVLALDAGADDYVTKPFGMDELLARLRAAERRLHRRRASPCVETDAFTVDLGAARVSDRRGRRATHAHRVASRRDPRAQPGQAGEPAPVAAGGVGSAVPGRDELPSCVHGPDPAQARARPGRPRFFITEPGMGYRFEPR